VMRLQGVKQEPVPRLNSPVRKIPTLVPATIFKT
jgi:hypothetical protein